MKHNRLFSSIALLGASAIVAGTASGQTLVHRYSFSESTGNTTFADSVGGTAWAGSLMGSAWLDGSSLQLDGVGAYATLPPAIVSGLSQATIEFWATLGPNNPDWTRVFAFGSQNDIGQAATSLDYCHKAGGNWQNLGLRTPVANVWANNPGGLDGTVDVHVTCVVNPGANQLYYYNGTRVASNPGVNNGSVPPLSGVSDVLCYLGKSLYDADATLLGSINEFRIYQGAVTSARVAINDASGPDNYVADPGALQAVHLTSPDNPLLVNQTSLQLFTGDFANVAGVNLAAYGGANFTSGNTTVLTVNPSTGLVTAVSPGTTTVIATFGGKSATNSITVVTVPAVLAHRYSFTADVTDSIGGAHGTLMGAAVIAGGKAILDGSGGTYIDLPGDKVNIATNRSLTIDTWVDFGDVPSWSRLFDFGADGGSSELYLTPRGPGNGGSHWLSENFAGGRTVEFAGTWSNRSMHVTCVVDPPSGRIAIYKDGVLERAQYDATAALSLISTNLAVIGRSLVPADQYMPGSIDEFRIYSGALSGAEIALAHKSGPNSTLKDPGALLSVKVAPEKYPAYSSMVPPLILATYVNLTDFNLLPNNSAVASGLTLTSSDPTILEVLPNNMLRTGRPGTVTLTASYLGKTHSGTVSVGNMGTLAHRYNFTTDANDSVGTAHGTLQGNASVSAGNLVLDGSDSTYLELPPALLQGYEATTIDFWATFNTEGTWARIWYFGDDRANEFYIAPSVNGATAHRYSTGFPYGGDTMDISPRWENETLHVTAVYGNGTMELYTNGVLQNAINNSIGRLDQVGTWFSWIGKSPYADPYMNCNIDEFRIYRGRLAPDEILASQAIGPNQLLASTATLQTSVTGANLVLRWPVAAAGFSVQATSDLGAGTWSTLPNAPALVGSNWQVTVPIGATPQYFRLWR